MKKILEAFVPFYLIKTFSNLEYWKEILRWLSIILMPLILITVGFNLLILFGSFITWKIPNSMYFPFLTGGTMQHLFDRLMVCLGFLFLIMPKDE